MRNVDVDLRNWNLNKEEFLQRRFEPKYVYIDILTNTSQHIPTTSELQELLFTTSFFSKRQHEVSECSRYCRVSANSYFYSFLWFSASAISFSGKKTIYHKEGNRWRQEIQQQGRGLNFYESAWRARTVFVIYLPQGTVKRRYRTWGGLEYLVLSTV